MATFFHVALCFSEVSSATGAVCSFCGFSTWVFLPNNWVSSLVMNLTNLEHALDKQLGNEATTFIRIGKRFIVNKRYICKVNIPKQRLVITDYDRFTFQLPISRDALKQLKALITLSTEKK